MPTDRTDQRKQAITEYIRTDPFAEFLGVEVEIPAPGQSRASLTVSSSMANFHGLTHGGLIFSLSDIAFAAASNSSGQTAVALNVAINYLQPSRPGDRLVAEAREVHAQGPTAVYDIRVTQERSGEVIARSQNLVYRRKEWFLPPDRGSEES